MLGHSDDIGRAVRLDEGCRERRHRVGVGAEASVSGADHRVMRIEIEIDHGAEIHVEAGLGQLRRHLVVKAPCRSRRRIARVPAHALRRGIVCVSVPAVEPLHLAAFLVDGDERAGRRARIAQISDEVLQPGRRGDILREQHHADDYPDESFAKSLLGRSYSGDLDLEGWTSFGGGLVSPPIYVHLYQREDGTSLVLTSKLSSRKYVVTDALMISKPWKGYEISIACTQGDDFTLRFIGDARGPDEKEWWTEVRRAWEIVLQPKPESDAESESEGETETAAEPAETKPEPQPGKTSEASTKG